MTKKKKPVSQKKYGKKAREDEKKKFKEGHKAYIEMKKDLDRDNPRPNLSLIHISEPTRPY